MILPLVHRVALKQQTNTPKLGEVWFSQEIKSHSRLEGVETRFPIVGHRSVFLYVKTETESKFILSKFFGDGEHLETIVSATHPHGLNKG